MSGVYFKKIFPRSVLGPRRIRSSPPTSVTQGDRGHAGQRGEGTQQPPTPWAARADPQGRPTLHGLPDDPGSQQSGQNRSQAPREASADAMSPRFHQGSLCAWPGPPGAACLAQLPAPALPCPSQLPAPPRPRPTQLPAAAQLEGPSGPRGSPGAPDSPATLTVLLWLSAVTTGTGEGLSPACGPWGASQARTHRQRG